MSSAQTATPHAGYDQRARYEALMDVVRIRMTSRQFEPDYVVPREHYELILEAARHAPSGANSQPWHYIIVTKAQVKKRRRSARSRAGSASTRGSTWPSSRSTPGCRRRGTRSCTATRARSTEPDLAHRVS